MAVRLFVGNMPYGATEADLRAHFAGVDGPGQLEYPVGQRRLPMVDVGDDRKIPDAGEFHGGRRILGVDRGWGRENALLASLNVANIKSQKKRILTNAKREARNKAAKSELRTRVKSATASIGTDANGDDVRVAMKRLDKAAAKGIIHPNQAARRKSRLMKKINAAKA